MRKLFVSIFFLLISLVTYAADLPWTIQYLPYDNVKAKESINNFIAKGFYPTGMEIIQNANIIIMFSKNSPWKTKEWEILQYTDAVSHVEESNQAIGIKLKAGWLPIDISIVGKDLFVLYVKSASTATAFSINPIPLDEPKKITDALEAIGSKSYTPLGLTVSDNLLFILSVNFNDTLPRKLSFKKTLNDGDQPFILLKSEAESQKIPLGFCFSSKDYFQFFQQSASK